MYRSIESVAVMRNDVALLYVAEVGADVFESIDMRGVHPRTKGESIPVVAGPSSTVSSVAGSLRNLHVVGNYLHARLVFADSEPGEHLFDLFDSGHFNLLYPPFDYALQRNRWVKKGPLMDTTDVTLLGVTANPLPSRMFAERAALSKLG